MKNLISALRTLTVIPVPGKENRDLSRSLPWFPVVGLILGTIIYGIAFLWTKIPLPVWPAGGALILVIIEIWLTRGLHLDGLADWADSFGGLYEREKKLAIMKDVRVGAFGALALIVDIAAKWVAFERILSSGSVLWLLVVFVLSRGMMVDLITRLPYARKEEGMSQPFIKGASFKHRVVSHILCLIICLPFGIPGIVAFLLSIVVIRIFGWRCHKQFDGITGDLIGASNEIVEFVLLMTFALFGVVLNEYTGWTWLIN